jgi:hypothetical protein
MLPEIGGEQSRRRNTRQRRLLLALAGLVVLGGAVVGGAVVGGIALDRLVLDDGSGITDAEHDRLVDACVAKDLDRASCTSWLADIVEVAEAEGVDYARLANYTNAMLQAFDEMEAIENQEDRWREAVDTRMQRTCGEFRDLPSRLCVAFRDI